MLRDDSQPMVRLTGHALRNAHLRERSLERAENAPPLARALVGIRAGVLGLTRLELARQSGLSRGTLRDLELGIHTPTRRVLQRFITFCRGCDVPDHLLEELYRLYAGTGDTLERFIARLELLAGSSRELARRVGISPATLWEYRRGNFPLPLPLLRRLCEAAGADPAPAEALWHAAERERLLQRGYPPGLAEFWVLCARAGHAEKHLPALGIGTAALRRLRYLEMPAWEEVAEAARTLCRDDDEWHNLEQMWRQDEEGQSTGLPDAFGRKLQQLRKRQGVTRRELADLFAIGGKKPARIIKYIEEDGFYSAQAHPAGLAALLARDAAEQERLLEAWRRRRRQFHRRHRPETRVELRLARELYGFTVQDMEAVLGYTRLEYQRIERGVGPLLESARQRILDAIHQAGRQRIEELLARRTARAVEQTAWQSPPSVPELIALLAAREGGLVPLSRHLRRCGLRGLWTTRLRAIARGEEVPPWQVLAQVGEVCGVSDLEDVRRDWVERYRARLKSRCPSPLGVEIRLLIGEVATSLRAFSPRLGFNYSVLVRNLHRLDRDEPIKWAHVERILKALGVTREDERWLQLHALWSTAADRRKRSPTAPRRWAAPS
jgi:transcriptional regulator with XRE-family HTH domain